MKHSGMPRPITDELIRQMFDETTANRGLLAFRKGHVHALREEDGVLNAQVDDENRQSHSVMVHWRKGVPVGNCSCATGFHCRHVAATLFAWMEGGGEVREEASEPVAEETHPFSLWLGGLERTRKKMPQTRKHATSSGQCVVYVLQWHPRDGLVVGFHLARLLKDGSYGRMREYRPANALKSAPPAYLQAVDLRILRMAACDHEAALRRHYRLHGEDDVRMLRQLIDSGRCHWRDPSSAPIRLGDDLPARWRWQTDDRGVQRLSPLAEYPGLLLIPVFPPWYLDPDQGVCGRLQLPDTSLSAEELLHFPPIEPGIDEHRLAELRSRLPADVPLPRDLSYRKIQGEVRSRLELRSLPTPDIYHGVLPRYIHVVELWQEYPRGHRHPWVDDEEEVIRVVGDTCITDYVRDREQERRALRILHEYGLRNDVQWLRRLPLKAHQFTLPTIEEWGQWLVEKQQRLAEEEGVELVVHPSFRYRLVEVAQWTLDIEGQRWSGEAHLQAHLPDGEKIELNDAIATWVERNPWCLHDGALESLRQMRSVALPLPRGRVLPIQGEMLAHVIECMQQTIEQQSLGVGQLLVLRERMEAQQVRVRADDWLEGARALLRPELRMRVPPPEGLRAQLRDYQRACLDWLQMLARAGMHGMLADDMGLGKTVQALAHILKEKEQGYLSHPALVICPTSLAHNWIREARRFTPGLSLLLLHGGKRMRHFPHLANYDLVVSTYPLLIRDIEALQAQHWHVLVLDEAQYIKNPASRSAQAVRCLQADHRLCMTGTPVENHLGDLWSQFDFLMPGYLGDYRRFRRVFQIPIENEGDGSRQHMLNLRIQPFILRRRKEDVATELPSKSEILHMVTMGERQRALYEGVRLSMQRRVREAIANAGLGKSRMIVLSALLRMRQVCCDPRLLPGHEAETGGSAKLDALRDMLPEMLEEGRRILLFSQFTSMLRLIESLLRELDVPYVQLTGKTRGRQQAIDRFQRGEVPLFLISLKAGGTGLNLTAADTVIHYDPWWNPAAEQQATDRAHRIGQDKPVFVYKLIAEGSVEEKILDLQRRKQALAERVHARDEFDLRHMSEEDLYALFESMDG